MLSPGEAFLARPPRRTAASTPASSSLTRSHGGLRPQPPRYAIPGLPRLQACARPSQHLFL